MPPRHNRTVDTCECRGRKRQMVVSLDSPLPRQVLPPNSKRLLAYFVNLDTADTIWIGTNPVTVNGTDAPLSDANGIVLEADGGEFSDGYSFDAWYAVTNSSLANLLVVEVTAEAN